MHLETVPAPTKPRRFHRRAALPALRAALGGFVLLWLLLMVAAPERHVVILRRTEVVFASDAAGISFDASRSQVAPRDDFAGDLDALSAQAVAAL